MQVLGVHPEAVTSDVALDLACGDDGVPPVTRVIKALSSTNRFADTDRKGSILRCVVAVPTAGCA